MMAKSWIPKITDQRLFELNEKIKPVVDFPKKGPCYIKPVDLRKIAFLWNPRPTKRAVGLVPLTDIQTYHTFGYAGLFKPSIAEVLAQIPKRLIDKTVAFQIVDWPKDADALNANLDALNHGYHVATTRLYEKP